MTTAVAERPRPQPNAIVQERDMTFSQYLEAKRDQIEPLLPAHVSFDRFRQVTVAAVRRQPDLAAADGRSLFEACLQCAQDGLMPDGREAHLGVYNTKVKIKDERGLDRETWIKKVQYMPMVQGLLKLMRQSGDVSSVVVQVVRVSDRFEYDPASGQRPTHWIDYDKEAGDLKLAYAIIQFRDGSIQVEVMRRSEIDAVRARSKSKDKGPWVTDYEEMARKTVLRRASKYVTKSPELVRAIDADNATFDLTAIESERRAALPRSLADDYAPEVQALEAPEEAQEAEIEIAGDAVAEPVEAASEGPEPDDDLFPGDFTPEEWARIQKERGQ